MLLLQREAVMSCTEMEVIQMPTHTHIAALSHHSKNSRKWSEFKRNHSNEYEHKRNLVSHGSSLHLSV